MFESHKRTLGYGLSAYSHLNAGLGKIAVEDCKRSNNSVGSYAKVS